MFDLGFPAPCLVNRVLFKKLFHDAGDLSKTDKALLTDMVDKVTWAYNLRRDNTMIAPYQDEARRYDEVQVLHVLLRGDKGVKRLAEIIMRAIPYPMLLVFEWKERYAIALAHQRTNLADSSKNTLEDLWLSGFLPPQDALFSALQHDKQPFSHFYDYYAGWADALCRYLARQAGASEVANGAQARKVLYVTAEYNIRLAGLRAKLKKETRFNRKMELNIEIKKLGAAKAQLLRQQEDV